MPDDANGRVWLITGCSTCFGRELARLLLDRGDRVAVTARDAARVRDLVEGHGDRGLALSLDVTDPAQVAAAVRDVEARFGALDVLVNNAGYGYQASVEEGEDAAIRAMRRGRRARPRLASRLAVRPGNPAPGPARLAPDRRRIPWRSSRPTPAAAGRWPGSESCGEPGAMTTMRRMTTGAALGLLWLGAAGLPGVAAQEAPADRSGRELRGQASVYAPNLSGRRMADGGVFEPDSDTVASNLLPLGTVARVTNLRNGRTAMVRVRDRGAFAEGRVVNVSPKVAEFLGMNRNGVARVTVSPLAVPQPGGRFRLGAGTESPGRRAAQPPRDVRP